MSLDLKPPVSLDELRKNQSELKELMTYLNTAKQGGDDVDEMIKTTQARMERNKQLRNAWYPGQVF